MVGTVGAAFGLGAVAQISLLLSGLLATWITVPTRIVGWLGGFGAGALMSAVAFDLVGQAEALGGPGLVVWLLLGAAVFIVGDYLVERRLGSSGGEGSALGIVLGAIVDGVP
jgi:ZIP family zinc transporter